MASGSTPIPPAPPTPPGTVTPAHPPSAGGNTAPLRPPRYRRRSIFSGLLLIVIGVLLLVEKMMPSVDLGYWIAHYWPVPLILWGVSKLIDRLSYSPNEISARPPMLTGGEAVLIAFLIIAVGAVLFQGWLRGVFPRAVIEITPFTQSYSQTQQVTADAVPPGSKITVTATSGDLTIHGGAGNSLLVNAKESARGGSEASAKADLANLKVVAERTADGFGIHPVNDNSHIAVDLDVQVPANVSVSAQVQRGDVNITGAQGNAQASLGTGDVTIQNTGGDVTIESSSGDTHIAGAGGSVHFTGHGAADIDIEDVHGSVLIDGNTFGDLKVRKVAKGVRYTSQRTTLSIAGLAGELSLDPGDIEISHATGPIQIAAHNQDVKARNIDGQFDLTAERGDIDVSYSVAPHAAINIATDAGDVTLSLPAQSNFTLVAVSKSGDVDNDFGGAQSEDDSGMHSANATYGSGGPVIHIATKYGDIHIRKN